MSLAQLAVVLGIHDRVTHIKTFVKVTRIPCGCGVGFTQLQALGYRGALYSGGRRRGVTTTVVLLLVYNLGVRRRDAEDVRKRKRKSNRRQWQWQWHGSGVAEREKRFIFGQRAEDN